MSSPSPDQQSKRDLTSGSLGWHLFRLAAPTALGSVMHSLYNLVDAFWLGKAGRVPLAAPGLAAPLFFIVVSVGYGFGIGGTALVSQYTGAGRAEEAERAAGQTILLLCTIVLCMALPVILLAPHLLRLFQAPDEALATASIYLRIFMLGLPFMAFTMAYGSVLRALGDTITVVVALTMGHVANLVLDPILIFGWGRIPAMGAGGAALASVMGQALSAVLCFVSLRMGRAGLRLRWCDMRPDWPMLKRAAAVGLPAAVSSGINSGGYAAFQIIINTLGTTVVTAMTVGWRVLHFFNWPMHAISSAATPIVGQALGAGKPEQARRVVTMSARLFGIGMLVPTALLMWHGKAVARFFIDDAEVVAEAGRFFLVVPASTYCFGMLMVLMAAFYGSGHTRVAMAVSIVRVVVVRLPVAFLLAYACGLGSTGAFLGMVSGNVVAAGLALWLFLRGGWQTAVVHEGDERQP